MTACRLHDRRAFQATVYRSWLLDPNHHKTVRLNCSTHAERSHVRTSGLWHPARICDNGPAANNTGRVIQGKTTSTIPGEPDIPCFLLVDDPANELLLPFGLGSHRILPPRLADLCGGGQLGEGADLRLAAANQSELIEMMITNSASANAMPISQGQPRITAPSICRMGYCHGD
jgi:hypothetical protein